MEFQKIEAKLRTGIGKGASRRLRSQGLVPGVVYGRKMETTNVAIAPRDLIKVVSGPLRTNTVFTLDIQGGKEAREQLVMVRDHDYHPLSRKLLHVDFLAIDVDQEVRVEVPVRTVGKSQGEKDGGIVMLVHRMVHVLCLPTHVPEVLEIDITRLGLNEHLSVKDVVVSEGARIDLPPGATIVSVAMPRAEEKAAAATDEAAAAAAAPAEGEKKAEPEKKAEEKKGK